MSQYEQIYKDFVEKSNHSKSTILKPLGWLLAILVPLFSASYYLKADNWISYSIATLIFIVIVIYLTIYIHAYFKNPELLRSEKYTLTKMAIEKSTFGDSTSGIVEIGKITTNKSIEGK